MATFKVYHGAVKPLTAQGKNQVHLLHFLADYPQWHSHAQDRATLKAVDGLFKRGSIKKNTHGQIKIAYGA